MSFIPYLTKIEKIVQECNDTKTFWVEYSNSFNPGQFVEISVLGYGEAPISIAGGYENGIMLSIRAAGNVTKKLHNMKEGDVVGIRGPFGKPWPVNDVMGENLLMIAGGIGLAPLRPCIMHAIENRNDYGEVLLLYGARSPVQMLYRREYEEWRKSIDMDIIVDRGDESWKGKIGLVTELMDEVDFKGYAFVCGPPVMMKFVSMKLLEMGFDKSKIFLSLERNMKCGMGICGHCAIAGKYVCLDGPVFSLEDAMTMLEKPVELEGVL
ncbi:MAG: FAD/NAD(P)-binding protein [Thermoplasmata archaeon]|nr:FAD/NAD(P)-binding protein [Thermoplasmata archaeon]